MLNNIKSKLDLHTLEIIGKASSSLGIKILGMVFGFSLSVLLGRTLGVEGVGVLNLTERIISILITLVLFGSSQFLIREIAIAVSKYDFKSVAKFINSSLIINGLFALIICVLMIFLSSYLSKNIFLDNKIKVPLIIASIAMVPQVLSRIFSSGLIGFKMIWQSNLVNETLSVFFTFIIFIIFYLFGFSISVVSVSYMYAISRLSVTIFVGKFWFNAFELHSKFNFIPNLKYLDFRILLYSFPFLLITAKAVLFNNVDSIMLGWLADTKAVGLYSVAAKISLLTSFFLQISNSTISPKIAAMYSKKMIFEINLMVQRITFGLFVFGIIFLIFIIIFGYDILLFWGDGFQEAYYILLFLTFGQFINISTGAAGLVLVMSGFEKLQARISIFFLLLNIILNFFLIYNYQALGAALATSIVVSLENITKVYFAKKKTNISTIPIDLIKSLINK